MGSGGVPPGRDPPVRVETAHQSERTRVTRVFLPGKRSSARSDWGAGVGKTALADDWITMEEP